MPPTFGLHFRRIALLLSAFLSPWAAQALLPAAERQALESLYASTNGAGWLRKDGWLGPAGSECVGSGWYGVRCDAAGDHVIGVELADNRLQGSLPEDLENLSQLVILNLTGNELRGGIPETFGRWSALRELRLAGNLLRGAAPRSLLVLSSAATIDLRWNALVTEDLELLSFLDRRSPDFSFLATQTVPPTQIRVSSSEGQRATLIEWEPSPYIANSGGYRILHASSERGPFEVFGRVATKYVKSFFVIGSPANDFFAVETFTSPHASNHNEVVSLRTPSVHVPAPPHVPTPGQIAFFFPFVDIAEGETFGVPVHRFGGSEGNVSVLERTVPLTAGPADFTAAPQKLLQWKDGEIGLQGILVTSLLDSQLEPPEEIQFILEQPSGGATLGLLTTGYVRIIDSDVSGSGQDPVVARDAAGNLLFVWVDTEPSGSKGIFGRFANPDGRPSGPAFQISQASSDDERNPGVVALDEDKFRVAWEDQRGAVRRDVTRIRGGVGFSTQIEITRNLAPNTLDLAADPTGNVALVWRSGDGLFGRFLRADGSTIRTRRLDGPTAGIADAPAIAFDSDTHDLLVVWEQKLAGGDTDIYGRFFSATGAALGAELRIHRNRTGRQAQPRLLGTGSGFLVAWRSTPIGPAPDPAGTELRAAQIDVARQHSRADFRINSQRVGSQSNLTMSLDAHGDCALAWLRDGSEQNGLFTKTLPDCAPSSAAEQPVSIFERRTVLTPLLFRADRAVGVVYEVGDTVAGNGGIGVDSLP
jgi:hypothetical protein